MKITGDPWIEPNGKRGEWIIPTNKGLLTFKELGKLLGKRPASLYEGFRRHGLRGIK